MTTIEAHEDDRGGWTVLRLRGELDLVTSPRIRRRVHDAVAAGRHHLVVDLSGVVFCDSSGVGVLVAARRLLRSCGGRLRLVLPEPGADHAHVTRVFAALGVIRLFEVYEDVPSALVDHGPAIPAQPSAPETRAPAPATHSPPAPAPAAQAPISEAQAPAPMAPAISPPPRTAP
ncbi:STAS domain-containing protein [Streptomyces filamentosus]|uniref:STAS domain-containing protein n=1 Tax=Streptomyces filamentosus TaxID=67294 RepID=UPI0037F49DEA